MVVIFTLLSEIKTLYEFTGISSATLKSSLKKGGYDAG